jgi:tetratricopeptide (TPR) repeat protein
VLLLATSTLLSVGLAVAVNVATGGSLPGPLDGARWVAWPLVAALGVAVAAVAAWEARADDGEGDRGRDRGRVGAGRGTGLRPAELPPDIVRFAGRHDDLEVLLSSVAKRPAPGLGRPTMLGIFGAGGTGKTVLATRLAHAVAARFPDGQLFVELRGASPEPADPAEVLRRLVQTLGVASGDVPEDPAARQALYRTLLADRRVLLYLDDAGSEEQVGPLVPAGSGCLVLVTARPSLMRLGLTAWRDLTVLSEAAAADVLVTVSGQADRLAAEPEAAAEVARLCGHLPLALVIAAARLRTRPHWTVADLAARLADERRRLDELQVGHLDVRASIRVSYGDLDEVGARLFRRLALVGHADFGSGVAAALLGGIDHWPAAEATLDRLADAKLIEVTGPRRYRFHDLVRLFAREQLEAEEPEDERQAALLRSLEYYAVRTQAQWEAIVDPATGDQRRADAEAWFVRSRSSIVAAVRLAAEVGQLDVACRLAAAAAPYLEARAFPNDLAAVAGVAVEAARATGDRAELAQALRNLGQAERQRSRHDLALAAFTESLDLWRTLQHDEHVAESLQRVGDSHRETGRYDEAEEAYTQAIDAFGALDRPEEEAVTRSSLALAWLLAGRIDEATALIEQAVDQLGVGDPAARPDQAGAWALETLGAARRANGSPATARECHERSLASFRSRGERYGSAYALLNLGRCAADLGRTAEARDHFAAALRLFSEMGSVDGEAEVHAGLAGLTRR